jgi:hypothetical protein
MSKPMYMSKRSHQLMDEDSYAIEVAQDEDGIYSEDEYLQAWQHLVDTGLAWTLKKSYGDKADNLIQMGLIKPSRRRPFPCF